MKIKVTAGGREIEVECDVTSSLDRQKHILEIIKEVCKQMIEINK